jgi:hypothetical protein
MPQKPVKAIFLLTWKREALFAPSFPVDNSLRSPAFFPWRGLCGSVHCLRLTVPCRETFFLLLFQNLCVSVPLWFGSLFTVYSSMSRDIFPATSKNLCVSVVRFTVHGSRFTVDSREGSWGHKKTASSNHWKRPFVLITYSSSLGFGPYSFSPLLLSVRANTRL